MVPPLNEWGLKLCMPQYAHCSASKPMEVFEQETSNAVMSTLLINDLRNQYRRVCPPRPPRLRYTPWLPLLCLPPHCA